MSRPHPFLAAALLGVLLAGASAVRAEDPPAVPVAPKVGGGATRTLAEEQLRIQRAVDDLRPVVAKLRGLPWKQPVEAAVMTREELRAYMLTEMEKEVTPAEWARDTRILHRLGLLKPDEDPKQLVLHMYQSAVAGFYSPDTKQLFVIEGLDVEGQQPTMVHELIHALEDQHFDLEAMEEPYRENDPDRQFAIRCLWEGSAEYARRAYQDTYPDVARHYYAASEKNPGQEAQRDMMRTVPTHMLLATLLHYRIGPNFVSQVLDRYGYKEGMQRLIDDPPTSQEQVLHPWKWFGPHRDLPRTVHFAPALEKTLGEGWTKLDEHSVGEVDLAVYLDYFVGDLDGRLDERSMGFGRFVDGQSNRAAQGWDAGRTIYLENEKHDMVVIHAFAFDTEKDADDAARFLGAARRKAHGDSWKGDGWVRDEQASVTTQSYDFTCEHGRGRILQRGREVLLLDGAPEASFDALWGEVAKTTFEKHADDQGDDPADPYEGCAVVDRQRGLGLRLPGEGWTAKSGGRSPVVFASAQKGEVEVTFLVIDQEVSQAGLPRMGKLILGPMFSEDRTQPSAVMGHAGLVHPILSRPGTAGRLHVASDAARTYMVIVTGPTDQVRAADGEIQRLLQGMPGPLAPQAPAPGPDLEGEASAAPAGLRSIPGY